MLTNYCIILVLSLILIFFFSKPHLHMTRISIISEKKEINKHRLRTVWCAFKRNYTNLETICSKCWIINYMSEEIHTFIYISIRVVENASSLTLRPQIGRYINKCGTYLNLNLHTQFLEDIVLYTKKNFVSDFMLIGYWLDLYFYESSLKSVVSNI